MSLFTEAIDRLKQYNLGIYNAASNLFGLSGVGGMAANWSRHSKDLATVGEGVASMAEAVTAGQAAAAASVTAAAASASSANADAQAAHADRLAADADVAATAFDRTSVAADKAAVHADRLAADADAAATAADRSAVAADKAATRTDRLAADADAQATAADRSAVAADKASVASDKAATHTDRLAADAAAASAAASAAGLNLPAISASDAGKALIVKPDGTGYQVGSAAATVAQSAPIYMTSPGTTTLTGKSVLAAYEQIAGQTFGVPYTALTDYVRDPSNSTAITGGVVSMTNIGGAQIDSNTKLLIHADGVNGSTEIIDERGITPFGTHCGYFDGSSYWQAPASYKVAFGSSQEFTIEFWYRLSSLPATDQVLIDFRNASNEGAPAFWLQGSGGNAGKLGVIWSGTALFSTTTVTTNAWHHVAMFRKNGTMYVTLDGVVQISSSTSYTMPALPIYFGTYYNSSTSRMIGWLDQVRVSKISRYTGAFTPPAAAFTTDADTVHLFTFDDGHGGQVLKDRANSGHPINIRGGSSISTAQAKFGTSSLYAGADGSGGGLTADDGKVHNDFWCALDMFTVDFWVYAPSLPSAERPLFYWGDPTTYKQPSITISSTGQIKLYLSFGNSSYDRVNGTVIGTVSAGTWNHIALTRDASNIRAFVGGVLGATVGWLLTEQCMHGLNAASIPSFGRDGTNNFPGYIDEVRIKRGEAVWTANFTPPTAAYTTDDRTILLCHFDGTNGDKVTLDSSGSSYGINAFGDSTTPNLSITNTGALTATYTRGGHATSLAIDGSGSQYPSITYAVPGAGHPFYLGNRQSWCIEMWIYISAMPGSTIPLFEHRTVNGGSATQFNIVLANNGVISLTSDQSAPSVTGPAASIGWNHIALVYGGTGVRIYTNGVGGTAVVTSWTPVYTAGGTLGVNLGKHQGAVDSFRLTTGSPRYTANFTPATLIADDATTLMWEFNGAVGQKWVKELSQNTALIAANGNARTVKDGFYITPTIVSGNTSLTVSTANAKFGTGSLFANSTTGNKLSLPNFPWMSGANDLTIDCWVYPTVSATNVIAQKWDGTNETWQFWLQAGSNYPTFRWNNNGVVYAEPTAVSLNTWTHLMVTVSATGVVTIYINGTKKGTGSTLVVRTDTTGNLYLGGAYDGTGCFQGYIDELRISSGIRQTASFTVPALAYGQQYTTGPGWIATKPGVTSLDLSAFSSIDTVTPTYSTPPNTSLTFLISTDAYATELKRWNGSAWVATSYSMTWNSGTGALTTSATPAQLQAVGNSVAELQAGLLALDAAALTSLNVVAILSTTNQQFTPTLDALNIGMDEYTLIRPVTDYTVGKKKAGGDQALTIKRVAAGNANMVFDYIPASS